MEMFSMEERTKSKHKFDGLKVCEAGGIRKCFIWEIFFGHCVNQIIYDLHLRNTLCYTS